MVEDVKSEQHSHPPEAAALRKYSLGASQPIAAVESARKLRGRRSTKKGPIAHAWEERNLQCMSSRVEEDDPQLDHTNETLGQQ